MAALRAEAKGIGWRHSLARHKKLTTMFTSSHSETVIFGHPFELKAADRILPPGNYRVVTDEELIEELPFLGYRRVSTMIFVPGQTYNASVGMVAIDPLDLQAALDRDIDTQSA
jgi:hypothetical protein